MFHFTKQLFTMTHSTPKNIVSALTYSV